VNVLQDHKLGDFYRKFQTVKMEFVRHRQIQYFLRHYRFS